MNCDEFPALFESDDPNDRRLAEQHAARCPRCRETLRIIGMVREELSALLTDKQNLARPAHSADVASRRPERFAVAAMAACLALAAAFLFVGDPVHRTERRVDLRPEIKQRAEIVRIEQDNSLQQLDELESELDRLSQRLDRIALRAALLEERRDLAQLTKQSR